MVSAMPMTFALGALFTFWAWWVLARSDLLERPREAAYNRLPPTPTRRSMVKVWSRDLGEMVAKARVGRAPKVSQLAKMLDCPWCAGFWIAGLVTLGLDLNGSVLLPALWWPATSIAAAALARLLR